MLLPLSRAISHFLPPLSPRGSLSPAISIPPSPGELRAHLVPRKASRGEGARRAPSQPSRDPLPPPLPKKQLQRAESLPEQGPSRHWQGDPTPWAASSLSSIPPPHPPHEEGAPSSIPPRDRPSWGPKRPLTKSQSLGEPVARSSPSPSPAEVTFGTADGELGRLLESPAGVCGVVLGCQVATLARLSARIQEKLLGSEERQRLLEAELAGKGWAAFSILEREPCCQSGDAWYFPVGFTFEQSQLVFAAKVSGEWGKTPRVVQGELAPAGAGGKAWWSGSAGFSADPRHAGASPFCTYFCICETGRRCGRAVGWGGRQLPRVHRTHQGERQRWGRCPGK